jgi:D,D-heptose 1,7-bisphosphate phosphatase
MNKAVFFDRDGTLNYDPGYLGNPDKVELFEGVPEQIKKLKDEFGFLIVVISNQSGITRGIISEDDVKAVNLKINQILKDNGTSIDAFYYCPFHPDYDNEEKCKCRKPSPFMVFEASNDLDLDLSKSYFVGDTISDIQCGRNAGVKTILIKSSFNKEEIIELKKEEFSPNFVSENFIDACNFIIKDSSGGN